MMKLNRNIVSAIPIVMLVYSGVSNYLEVSEDLYWVIGSSIGYSIATDIFMLYIVFNLRFCFYTRMSVMGLCLMTIVSLLNPLLDYTTNAKLYDNAIIGLCVIFCAIYLIKKWRHSY